ncbi:hypothetical protein NDU88_003353 [Pleurodeles waltl]|uniref:Uncharacterized protein n=1 Tax=Pleurodeles waltl TaxID=8319 RepID=A0AAV7REW1_PLEWA|nr:hypothetical protein NDU88_003353 [Pleurodeles waltl]
MRAVPLRSAVLGPRFRSSAPEPHSAAPAVHHVVGSQQAVGAPRTAGLQSAAPHVFFTGKKGIGTRRSYVAIRGNTPGSKI